MSRTIASPLAWLCLLLSPACIASSVVESAGRAVAPPTSDLDWRPAVREDLRGLFESISIEGEAAASLWKIYYVFAEDGSYSGAALVLGERHLEFQTLSGTWTIEGQVLDLGEGQATRAWTAADHLKLESDGSVAILRRAEVP